MKKKVLILDDDADILGVCEYILMDMGCEVATDNNCNDIIDKVMSIQPDLIFLDNWIPDCGGVDAIKELKKSSLTKDIPIILFSANTNLEDLARKAGADEYLAKPFEITELERLVAKLTN